MTDPTPPTPPVLDYLTAVNRLVRRACRETLGVAEGYFKPARQRRPAGATSYDYATVTITRSDMVSVNVQRLSPTDLRIAGLVPEGAVLVELVDPLDEVTASVNFYRSGATDAAGLPVAVNQTMSRASTLVKLLESSTAAERLRAYGLGYAGASAIRDLSDKVDGNYEDRAQVDLTIYASDPVLLVVTAFASAALDIKFQTSTGLVTTHAEVTP